jgi:NADH/NAD ratio-sensing transcriptional regulator Rex
LLNESVNLERIDEFNKLFKFSLNKKQIERAKSQEISETLGRSCNELINKFKDISTIVIFI